jgi:hypothetical protein
MSCTKTEVPEKQELKPVIFNTNTRVDTCVTPSIIMDKIDSIPNCYKIKVASLINDTILIIEVDSITYKSHQIDDIWCL